MAHGAVLLIGLALAAGPASAFYGASITFKHGKRFPDGAVEMHFYSREASRGRCAPQLLWLCDSGVCGVFTNTLPEVTDSTNQYLWCQSELHMATNVTTTGHFVLSSSGCCWENNVHGVGGWMLRTRVNTGRRSDTQSPNRSPVSATIPKIRIPQNCFQNLPLLAHDPDHDAVVCRFSDANCTQCHQHPNIHLDEESCTLHRIGVLAVGVHVFELMLEDHPVSNITVMDSNGVSVYNAFNNGSNTTALSQVPLQFGLEILPPSQGCVPGVNKPIFLSPTPLHGDVHHAAVGQTHNITLRAQISDNSIFDFQLSGPSNASKTLTNESHGVLTAILSWTPQETDLYRHVPVCFAAETPLSQSEMRCITVIVAKARVLSGEAKVICSNSSMSIVVSKASMDGIDQTWLQLRDPSCSLTSNQTHILGTVSLNTCGTTMDDAGDFIIFKNEINSFETANAVITRSSQVKFNFSCQYPKVANVSNHYVNLKSDYIFTESSFGTFGYSFEVFTNSSFRSTVSPSLYPLQFQLTDHIFMAIEAYTALPEVTLFVESCRATPQDNPASPVFHDIIKYGCVKDETLTVYPSNSTSYDFEIQAFKFTGAFNQVYISCSVILCAKNSSNSRCVQGCLDPSARRRRRDLSYETAPHSISLGPFSVVRQTANLTVSEDGGFLQVSARTGVFAGLFTVTIVALVGILVYNAKKMRSIDRMHLRSTF